MGHCQKQKASCEQVAIFRDNVFAPPVKSVLFKWKTIEVIYPFYYRKQNYSILLLETCLTSYRSPNFFVTYNIKIC